MFGDVIGVSFGLLRLTCVAFELRRQNFSLFSLGSSPSTANVRTVGCLKTCGDGGVGLCGSCSSARGVAWSRTVSALRRVRMAVLVTDEKSVMLSSCAASASWCNSDSKLGSSLTITLHIDTLISDETYALLSLLQRFSSSPEEGSFLASLPAFWCGLQSCGQHFRLCMGAAATDTTPISISMPDIETVLFVTRCPPLGMADLVIIGFMHDDHCPTSTRTGEGVDDAKIRARLHLKDT